MAEAPVRPDRPAPGEASALPPGRITTDAARLDGGPEPGDGARSPSGPLKSGRPGRPSTRFVASLLPVVFAFAAAGCGSDDKPELAAASATTVSSAATPTTVSIADLARQYLEAVAPGNEASKRFDAQREAIAANAASFSNAGQVADRFADAAEPFAAVLEQDTNRLARLPWLDSMRGHVDALVTARTAVVGTLRSARSARTYDSYSAMFDRVTAGFSAASAASNLLRADLGLPPPGQDTTSTTVGASK